MPPPDRENGRAHTFGGAYEPNEVASFLRTSDPIERVAPSAQRLRAWAHNGVLGTEKPAKIGRSLRLSFAHLTTSQVIAILRARGWSFKRIRETERELARLLQTPQPFTNRAFWTMGPDLLTTIDGKLVVGTRGGQLAFEEIVKEWLRPVSRHFGFDEQTGQAVSWCPVQFVELDPRIQFGAPCLKGTSIPTSALWGYVRGGDPIAYVARSYGLAVADVERAVAWEDQRRASLGAEAPVSA